MTLSKTKVATADGSRTEAGTTNMARDKVRATSMAKTACSGAEAGSPSKASVSNESLVKTSPSSRAGDEAMAEAGAPSEAYVAPAEGPGSEGARMVGFGGLAHEDGRDHALDGDAAAVPCDPPASCCRHTHQSQHSSRLELLDIILLVTRIREPFGNRIEKKRQLKP